VAAIRALAARGYEVEEIAPQVGVHKEMVRRYLRGSREVPHGPGGRKGPGGSAGCGQSDGAGGAGRAGHHAAIRRSGPGGQSGSRGWPGRVDPHQAFRVPGEQLVLDVAATLGSVVDPDRPRCGAQAGSHDPHHFVTARRNSPSIGMRPSPPRSLLPKTGRV